jgi:hypothetical protein
MKKLQDGRIAGLQKVKGERQKVSTPWQTVGDGMVCIV